MNVCNSFLSKMAKTASKGEDKNLHSLYKPLTVNQLSVEKFQRKKRGPARLRHGRHYQPISAS